MRAETGNWQSPLPGLSARVSVKNVRTELEALISASVRPGTARAMKESRQQEQGCSCMQGQKVQ